ncbi:L,D-transpeptidase [Corynebacterium lujinxingii]|uniref:L,D-transpeptidase n=1 Tax=Corynebacterium lujinxingii TaxID=2763010 RepID=A0A7H0JZT5_9CORY|nr:L,D-transpeptidase [Corynebacterium lujinxingii]MBC3178979.1 L,D-transpeptidase [Corynebacterium lujinxingii]NNO11411.1 L,D-transpeptidase family protein [Corynebacterium lujinxingii]QNP90551.1 L,D-transpeptidase [Corynebacterium lujinxingii]
MSYRPRHAKQSPLKRRATTLAAGLGVVATLAAPVTANAAPAQNPVATSSLDALSTQANAAFANLDKSARNTAWDVRNNLRKQADNLATINPDLPAQAKKRIDEIVEVFFPGLIAEKTPKPKPKPKPKPAPKPAPAQRPANPCPADAKACVDLTNQKSWLQNNGVIYYGPVQISSGRPGQETPKGTHYVNRKVKDEISYEFNNAPMPYSVYFTNNGIAFHQDDPYVPSAGCIHLYRQDAQRYFNDLQVGDKVYVF